MYDMTKIKGKDATNLKKMSVREGIKWSTWEDLEGGKWKGNVISSQLKHIFKIRKAQGLSV